MPAFTPAASPRLRRSSSPWPPHRTTSPASEFAAISTTSRLRTAHRPISVRLEPALGLRSVIQRFLTYTFPSLLAGPGLSDSSSPSRTLSEAAPTVTGVPRIRLPPSFTGQLRLTGGGVLSSPRNSKRLVAHERFPVGRGCSGRGGHQAPSRAGGTAARAGISRSARTGEASTATSNRSTAPRVSIPRRTSERPLPAVTPTA